jgi:APA family basic amino acid/polyamine antiporter
MEFTNDQRPTANGGVSLIRGVGLGSATALNMIDMIGVGPFITIPLIVGAMGGPQAMLGWVLGALFAVCDGLVWAELGAAMPGSGGSYGYLKEIYGPNKLGRLISFLFIWQLSFSAPLSIASGSIGLASYASYFSYLAPGLNHHYAGRDWNLQIPFLGSLQLHWLVTGGTFLAIGVVVSAALLLYRKITSIGWMSKFMLVGVIGTIGWIIFAGLTHFNAAQAFSFPPDAFKLSHNFFLGLGSAMLIATYDYWGYYNVSFLGDEVKDPGKTIPRALLLSILLVACLYMVMNLCILAVVPWQEITHASESKYLVSIFMERIYGQWAANLVTGLVIWTAFASVFALMLGYSRVPYAAAVDGNYFRAFARVHPKHRFPYVSLLALALAAALFCFFSLADVIAALVVIRITLQFLMQAIGLIVLRIRRPDLPRPFHMWLYPVPALLASVGFVFVVVNRTHSMVQIRYAIAVLITGIAIYMPRAWRNRQWPFGNMVAPALPEAGGR